MVLSNEYQFSMQYAVSYKAWTLKFHKQPLKKTQIWLHKRAVLSFSKCAISLHKYKVYTGLHHGQTHPSERQGA